MKGKADIFKALSDNKRIDILMFLKKEKTTHSDIQTYSTLSQPMISYHMKVLRKAGLVIEEKQGKHVYYSINASKIQTVCKFVQSFL